MNDGNKKTSETLFHGSNIVVRNPEVHTLGHYKDFGYGFYCTRFEKQAKKWALTKNPQHIVTVFEYFEKKDLNVLSFNELTDAWLNFVANCRKGVVHKYDIVEGPMADDQIWDYVEDFISGNISREAFWALARFKRPTHQIVSCTEDALKCIIYKEYYEI